MKFDHIGIVVRTLDVGRKHLNGLFGINQWTAEFADTINGVNVQFGLDESGICYELISPLGADSPVAVTLRSGNRILNHVAYLVTDISSAAARLSSLRCVSTGAPKPAIAYGGRHIQFFLTPMRMLIEIIEAPEHSHRYVSGAT